jgi:predicted molibdopterin-dependent oxidoreductase YjgC
MEAQKQPSQEAAEVLGRALVDDDFRKQLYDDPSAALEPFTLTEADRALITSIPPETFEQHATTFREGSVVGASWAIGVGAAGRFQAEEPEA